jgi:acyl transferase domain-containing protein
MAGLHNTSREDIVITGMACRFANVPNVTAFWRQIMSCGTSFSPLEFAGERESAICHKKLFDAVFPEYAAKLGDLFSCRISDQYFPRKIYAGENPDLFFAVQMAVDALRDSGLVVNSLPTDRISLRLGYAPPFNIATVNWLQHTFFLDSGLDIIQKFFPGATTDQIEEIRCQMASALPEANPYTFLSSMGSVISSWIAHLLGFAGPAVVLDEGAVSGIQALQEAMDDLLLRRSDIAMAGAMQPPLTKAFLQGFSGTFRFSREKTVRPFCRDSEGTLPGEGAAFFVLKRLKDAVRQGDRIYAIIRSTGISAAAIDQHQQIPTPERLERAISRALHNAECAPDSMQLIEANGSGVPHSDQTELQVMQDICGERRTDRALTGLGSVKGNIGHTLWASSAASVAKAALAIYHRVLPPQVPIERPYPRVMTAKSPIYLLTEARPWLRGDRKKPRRACVASIDFTGTCASAVLEEYPEGTV